MGPQKKEKYVVDLIKVVKKIVGPQRGKRIDVEQRDKSNVSSHRKEKHVVDLIKMVKKTVGPQRGQKNKKVKELLHYNLFTPLVNKSNGFTKRQKNERKTKSLFLFFYCTNFSFEVDETFFAQAFSFGF